MDTAASTHGKKNSNKEENLDKGRGQGLGSGVMLQLTDAFLGGGLEQSGKSIQKILKKTLGRQ